MYLLSLNNLCCLSQLTKADLTWRKPFESAYLLSGEKTSYKLEDYIDMNHDGP